MSAESDIANPKTIKNKNGMASIVIIVCLILSCFFVVCTMITSSFFIIKDDDNNNSDYNSYQYPQNESQQPDYSYQTPPNYQPTRVQPSVFTNNNSKFSEDKYVDHTSNSSNNIQGNIKNEAE